MSTQATYSLSHRGGRVAGMVALAASLLVGMECAAAWKAETDVDVPGYAVTEPAATNLNVDSVVLMCEAANDATVLQLQLYLSDDGPLRPRGVHPEDLKVDPRAEISVDGRVFPVSMMFADEYVVLADDQRGYFPMLSDRLLDAIQDGKRMVLRVDLAAEPPGQAATFDGEAVIELGSPVIATVRRCAGQPSVHAGNVALAGH